MSSCLLGRQVVLVHHQSGIAAITVTALGYQAPHLEAAKVLSPVRQTQPIAEKQHLLSYVVRQATHLRAVVFIFSLFHFLL